MCSRVSVTAMLPGNSASGLVPAGQPLMDAKAQKNHRWLSKNCNNSCQPHNFWCMWYYRGAGSSSRLWKPQIKAVSLCLCFFPVQVLRAASQWSSIFPLYPFLCLLSSLFLKSFFLLSACILLTGKSKHISCVRGGFQWHQSELSSRWKYLTGDTDTSPVP